MSYDKEKIKAFVQDVLGCGCEEEVFQTIEAGEILVSETESLRINVGNRLLVYVVPASEQETIDRELAEMVREGKADRDRNGFNRFRLVLSTDKVKAIERAAIRAFKAAEKDEKIHLHVIARNNIGLLK